MRLKAIPAEIETFAGAHPFVLGAIVIGVGLGAYRYTQSRVDQTNADPTASTMGAYGLPISLPVNAGDMSVADTLSNAAAQGNVTNMDLLNFQKTKEQDDYTLATKTLDANIAIAATNASIAMAGINATNLSTYANLANNFLRSGQQFFAGSLGSQVFAFLGSGTVYKGKNQKQVLAQQQTQYNQFLKSPLAQGLLGYVQPSSGTLSVAPYGSPTTTPASIASGSSSIATSISGSSAGSAGTSTYDPSQYSTSTFGAGGGGATGGAGSAHASNY